MAVVRSPDFLRALIRETALATLIHQRRLTPSCGGQAPTAERTVGPARMIAESLTIPILGNPGALRRWRARRDSSRPQGEPTGIDCVRAEDPDHTIGGSIAVGDAVGSVQRFAKLRTVMPFCLSRPRGAAPSAAVSKGHQDGVARGRTHELDDAENRHPISSSSFCRIACLKLSKPIDSISTRPSPPTT